MSFSWSLYSLINFGRTSSPVAKKEIEMATFTNYRQYWQNRQCWILKKNLLNTAEKVSSDMHGLKVNAFRWSDLKIGVDMRVLLVPVNEQHLTSHQVNQTQNHMSQYISVFSRRKNGFNTLIFSGGKNAQLTFFKISDWPKSAKNTTKHKVF